MPDWYRASLIARYQFLVDELAVLQAKHLFNTTSGIDVALFAVLSYFVVGNFWAPALTALIAAWIWNRHEGQKRFLIAHQLLAIEAEWPDVKENVALPTRGR